MPTSITQSFKTPQQGVLLSELRSVLENTQIGGLGMLRPAIGWTLLTIFLVDAVLTIIGLPFISGLMFAWASKQSATDTAYFAVPAATTIFLLIPGLSILAHSQWRFILSQILTERRRAQLHGSALIGVGLAILVSAFLALYVAGGAELGSAFRELSWSDSAVSSYQKWLLACAITVGLLFILYAKALPPLDERSYLLKLDAPPPASLVPIPQEQTLCEELDYRALPIPETFLAPDPNSFQHAVVYEISATGDYIPLASGQPLAICRHKYVIVDLRILVEAFRASFVIKDDRNFFSAGAQLVISPSTQSALPIPGNLAPELFDRLLRNPNLPAIVKQLLEDSMNDFVAALEPDQGRDAQAVFEDLEQCFLRTLDATFEIYNNPAAYFAGMNLAAASALRKKVPALREEFKTIWYRFRHGKTTVRNDLKSIFAAKLLCFFLPKLTAGSVQEQKDALRSMLRMLGVSLNVYDPQFTTVSGPCQTFHDSAIRLATERSWAAEQALKHYNDLVRLQVHELQTKIVDIFQAGNFGAIQSGAVQMLIEQLQGLSVDRKAELIAKCETVNTTIKDELTAADVVTRLVMAEVAELNAQQNGRRNPAP